MQRPEGRTKSGQPNSEVPNRWGNSSELAKVTGLKKHDTRMQDAGIYLYIYRAHLDSQNCYKMKKKPVGFVDSCQVTHPRVEEISSAQKDLARKVERFQAFWELMWGDLSETLEV